ncbi:MAG: response regulator [Deltaproteobacteria bacterium]|nr:response regulator [Deltaproteobacteria bacterium]
MSESNLLIVDDEPNVISALKRIFLDEPYRVYSAGSALEGMEILKEGLVKVVISDEKMPEITGSEFLSMARRDYPDIVRVMLTGHASIEAAMKAINEGEIYRFFMKPWNELELRFAVRSAFEKYDLEDENRKLLSVIRRQAADLNLIEEQYPGITRVRHDKEGRIVLPTVPDDEMDRIMSKYGIALD